MQDEYNRLLLSIDRSHNVVMERNNIAVRMPDSQSREPGFKSHCGRFEPLASLITTCCHSSHSCMSTWQNGQWWICERIVFALSFPEQSKWPRNE